MAIFIRALAAVGLIAGLASSLVVAAEGQQPRRRQFRLTYAVTVTELPPDQQVKIWMPVPPNNAQQRVHVVAQQLPGASQQGRESRYGNDILHVEAVANGAGREYYFGNLTENRVTFSVGRDLVLTPPQAGRRLNFFVMPFVEVGGQPFPAENVQLKL